MLVVLPFILVFTLLVVLPVLFSVILFKALEAKRNGKRIPARVEA